MIKAEIGYLEDGIEVTIEEYSLWVRPSDKLKDRVRVYTTITVEEAYRLLSEIEAICLKLNEKGGEGNVV
ncbi:MAG: hypothetical protein H8D23_20940 [Candidatus Brocadiales bacterium]|nr:hypothetical protein [Candidatus Brocadiales bacterium]